MSKQFIAQAIVLFLGVSSVYGQVNLSRMAMDSCDSLQKSRIRYFSPGEGGKDRVWDLSQRLSSTESSQVQFIKDSAGVVSVYEPDWIDYCRIDGGTLVRFAGESPTDQWNYAKPQLAVRFPLAFGDSVASDFHRDGVLYGTHLYRRIGRTTVRVDASGSVVLAEGDTLRNVTRVHTIHSYSVCMDIDSAALDTARLTQVIDERYDWYLPDSQYPIIEDVMSTSYYNMDAIGTTRYASVNLPESQTDLYVTPTDEEPDDEDTAPAGEDPWQPDIIRFTTDTHGGAVHISYDLDADASITAIVAGHTGMTYRHREWKEKAGQGYYAQIDCNGLRPGVYILYLNVNGKVYSKKITL